jgi:zeaxanthin epoxidase
MQTLERALSGLGRPAEGCRAGLPVVLLPQKPRSLRPGGLNRHPLGRSRSEEASFRHPHCSASVAAPSVDVTENRSLSQGSTKPRVIIAGAGIGGLVLAVGLLNKGFPVQCLERDLTAIRGEGKYRGPIQVPFLPYRRSQAIKAPAYCLNRPVVFSQDRWQ